MFTIFLCFFLFLSLSYSFCGMNFCLQKFTLFKYVSLLPISSLHTHSELLRTQLLHFSFSRQLWICIMSHNQPHIFNTKKNGFFVAGLHSNGSVRVRFQKLFVSNNRSTRTRIRRENRSKMWIQNVAVLGFAKQ